MKEIFDGPLSMHDLGVICRMLAYVRMREYQPPDLVQEIIVSARRCKSAEAFKVMGVTVRQSDTVELNEIVYMRDGRYPLAFDFEEDLRA